MRRRTRDGSRCGFPARGPIVYALDDRAAPDTDLRRIVVDPTLPVDDRDPRAVVVQAAIDESPGPGDAPYAPLAGLARRAPRDLVLRPYHEWPDGIAALRIWLPMV